MKILGVLLILAGIVALAYGGFTYTTHKRAVDVGQLQIETRTRHRARPGRPAVFRQNEFRLLRPTRVCYETNKRV